MQGDLTDDQHPPPTGTNARVLAGWLTPPDEVTDNAPDRTKPSQALRDLSYFPARDVEETVTKGFLRAELQTEIGSLRAELHSEIGGLRAEMLQTARATQTWIISTGLSLAGLILAVARFG